MVHTSKANGGASVIVDIGLMNVDLHKSMTLRALLLLEKSGESLKSV
jgi:hypothetical protein